MDVSLSRPKSHLIGWCNTSAPSSPRCSPILLMWGAITCLARTKRGLLASDLVILNHGQVPRTTPELAPPLLTTTPYQREDVFDLSTDLTCIAPLHTTGL
ncbi:hypothetical protein TNCV_3953491 [Trichonephila clavipes]|nr:hypothetical protein TNCV_3953491 [Trichonephila clavipes]